MAGDLTWPAGVDETQEIEKLTAKFSPEYGSWLAKTPALEDVAQLVRQVAEQLKDARGGQRSGERLGTEGVFMGQLIKCAGRGLGRRRKTFAGEVFNDLVHQREELWHDRVKHIDWELFDLGTAAFNTYAIEELVKGADTASLLKASRACCRIAALR